MTPGEGSATVVAEVSGVLGRSVIGRGEMSLRSYTQPAMSPSAPSAAAGRRRRVLLVHANPFQRVTPVPAYGLERLRTAAEDAGAEVQLLDPYLVSGGPTGTAREAARSFQPDLIGLGIRIIDDCIVVDRLDAPDDEPIDVSFLLPEIRELRRALGEAAPRRCSSRAERASRPARRNASTFSTSTTASSAPASKRWPCSVRTCPGTRSRDWSEEDRPTGSARTASRSAG